jgi:hypothetical protein
LQTYTVSVVSSNGGSDCSYSDGSTQTVSCTGSGVVDVCGVCEGSGAGADQYATGGACYDVTAPSDGFYISSPATSSSDNILSSCSTCDGEYQVASACTDTSDTACELIPVDCAGSWSYWSACDAGNSCDTGSQSRTFNVATAAVGSGNACEAAHLAMETQACDGTGTVDSCGDCNGANAAKDDCGVCDGDNSSCADCNDVPNGPGSN